jgi:hypothetical protein
VQGNISNTYYSVSVRDSGGVSIVRTQTDSAGTLVTKETIDSSRTRRPSPLELFRALRARDDSLLRARDSTFGFGVTRTVTVGSTLVSGLAPIRASLQAFESGKLLTYQQAIAMTKIDGWK